MTSWPVRNGANSAIVRFRILSVDRQSIDLLIKPQGWRRKRPVRHTSGKTLPAVAPEIAPATAAHAPRRWAAGGAMPPSLFRLGYSSWAIIVRMLWLKA